MTIDVPSGPNYDARLAAVRALAAGEAPPGERVVITESASYRCSRLVIDGLYEGHFATPQNAQARADEIVADPTLALNRHHPHEEDSHA